VADSTTYRLLVSDGLDFARANASAPANRTTSPVTFNHGSSLSARSADLFLAVGNATARRLDSIAISNNPTLNNQLDRDDGPAWDADAFTVSIPAGIGSTTVQVNSVPSPPDLLLWEMVALRVPVVP
jgi:hypothetical protein